MTDTSSLASLTAQEVRALCRSETLTCPTAGAAMGYVQANLVVLCADLAADFETFCRRNPRPCPLLEVTPVGSYEPALTAPGADLRTDLPRYRVLEAGVFVDQPTSVEAYWTEDCVAFLLGCSFTFEAALLAAGLPVRHIAEGVNVPMFRTNRECEPAGAFCGPLVVSMRPMTPAQAQEAERITAAFPRAHGAPVHIGDPAVIGIADLSRPDYGDAVTIREGEVPVFLACGVTPMAAIAQVRPAFAITHEPGHMFVTDLRDEDLREDSADE